MCGDEASTSYSHSLPTHKPPIARVPNTLPVIAGLHRSVHALSLETIRRLRSVLRSADVQHNGLIRCSTLILCIAEVVPGASHTDSPWRKLCDSISTPDQLVPYRDLIKLIKAEKLGETGIGPSIDEILGLQRSDHQPAYCETRRRTQSEKTLTDRNYAKLIIELELLIMKSPDKIDIDRLKSATDHKLITVKEFVDLVSIYGAEKLLEPIIGRIITAFQDASGKFNYTEFVKCLDRVQPSLMQNASSNSAPVPPPLSLASNRAPLGPILSGEREQPGASKWNDKEWEEFYMKEQEEE